MAKVTVYLPDDLNEKVQRLGVPISPTCQQALQEEVRRMEAVASAKKDVKKVAARLRLTADEEERGTMGEGEVLGIRWARETATLRELEVAADVEGTFWLDWCVPGDSTIVEFLVAEADADERWAQGDAEGNVRIDRDPFMVGFSTGAKKVYADVLPHLRSQEGQRRSHLPSAFENMAFVSLGSPLARTTRTASATAAPTESPVSSGVMEKAAIIAASSRAGRQPARPPDGRRPGLLRVLAEAKRGRRGRSERDLRARVVP